MVTDLTEEELDEIHEELQIHCATCGKHMDNSEVYYHITYNSPDGNKNVGHICSDDCLANYPDGDIDKESWGRR